MVHSFHDRVEEIERLADELNNLLAHEVTVLEYDGLYHKANGLARWARCYRHGLRYGTPHDGRTPHNQAWVTGVNDRLRLEAQELYSLDDRGELIDAEEPEAHPETEDFMEATRHILHAATEAKQHSILVPPVALRTMLEAQSRTAPPGDAQEPKRQSRVKDLMKQNPVILPPDCTLQEAAQEMENMNCGMLPVGTPERVEGVITDRDIVLRAVAKGKDISKEKVRDYMTPEICCVQEEDETYRAADLMRRKNVNRLLVKDGRGRPRGMLSMGRIVRENDRLRELTTVIDYAIGRQVA